MIALTKKNRLQELYSRYKNLIQQAQDLRTKGRHRLSFMMMEEADLVSSVIKRIERSV